MLDHVITEAVGEDFSREWRYCHAGAFALQDISEVLEVGVSPAHDGMLQLEGGDIRSADNFIGSVHVPGGAMGLRIADLI